MPREEHSDYLERWATTPGLGIGWENEEDEPESEFLVSEFLSSSVRLDIRRVVLAAQCERLRELANALEASRWRAEQLWEERCAELNALGGEIN